MSVKAASTGYKSEIFWVVRANLSKAMLLTVLGDAYSSQMSKGKHILPNFQGIFFTNSTL